MLTTLSGVLAVVALVLVMVAAAGKAPLWPAVFVLAVLALVQALPLR